MPDSETTPKTTGHRQQSGSPQAAKEAKGRDLGILAVVGVAVCCGLPLLVGAGALAAAGGFLRNAWVVAAAVVVVIATLAYFARRRRRASAADACCPPRQASSPTARHP